ncbi:MAG: hypothetical protein JWQ02_437 [Capsulimonas sp.]|nr:hypothetical protein [Capsulimonas sp.]
MKLCLAFGLSAAAVYLSFANHVGPTSRIPPPPPTPIVAWRWIPDEQAPGNAATMASPDVDDRGAGWRDASIGEDLFHGRLGYAWCRTTLPVFKTPPRRIHFESVDDNASVYLNGKLLIRHKIWNDAFDAPVGTDWRANGPNVLAVLVENTAGAGGILGPVRAEFADPMELQGGVFSVKIDPVTGGLRSITNRSDPAGMNWVHGGSQWGVGWVRDGKQHLDWKLASAPRLLPGNLCTADYQAGPVRIAVRRTITPQGHMDESYTITNPGTKPISLAEGDLGVRSPFNDSYAGGAPACVTGRCNAHIWCGGGSAYVCATRMGAAAPHLGLVLTSGAVTGYTIDGAYNSDDRGLISLNPSAMTLAPGQSRTISWTLFWHRGWSDFFSQAARIPTFLRMEASRYTLDKGETITITASGNLHGAHLSADGAALLVKQTSAGLKCAYRPTHLGEHKVRLTAGGRETFLRVFVTPKPMDLIQSRVLFIVRHQQRNAPGTPLDGAYLAYDNETNEQIHEDINDHNAGRERVGMGCLIARYLLTCRDPQIVQELRASLDRYYAFVNRELTDENGIVYGGVGRSDVGRLYNYPWVAELHVLMYQVTHDAVSLRRFVRTIQTLYSRGGTGFYCIGLPITEALAQLKSAGMTLERQAVLDEFVKHADQIAKNGANFPSSEVSYEQSIVAPAVQILAETYLATHDAKYLSAAKSIEPLMDSFNGHQPDYHLSDVAIRHWDDYWFGKSRQYGDTFPHYWTTITGVAFHDLALATHDASARKRAERIVQNNLCSFRPDGRASCAYVYPREIDGNPGQFFDAWANDQDWALDNYLIVMHSQN